MSKEKLMQRKVEEYIIVLHSKVTDKNDGG
jgi:hypothetical protein